MKLKIVLLPIFMLGILHLNACPTCVSSSDEYTPPFFSDEYYQPRKNIYVSQEETDEGEDYDEEVDDTAHMYN